MARVTGFWKKIGDTLQPVFTGGVNLLISGANRYLNFNSDTGADGYGIRDNNGTLQFKNESGSWTNFGSGGGGAVDSVNGQTGVVVLDADDIDDTATTNKFTTAGDISKLAGIEAGADVTDTTNVTAAGALMDSEVTNLAAVKSFNPADYATAAQGTLATNAIPSSQKGANNGVAELDAGGLVPASQLPSFVDDVIEVANFAALPVTGETGKIYVTLDTNLTYRWSGSAYVEISASLALGETSSTAYRGDRGKTAYDHSQLTSGNPHNVTKAEVGLGNVDNTSDLNKPISTATQTALDGKITAFADPNADRIVFWDDSAGAFAALTASTGLTISGTNMTVRTASTTQTGMAETATDAEFTTGTDTTRYVSANQVANVAQTMVNKTLTSPTITGGTFTGTADMAQIDYDRAIGTVLAIANINASRTFNWATATHFTGDLNANTTLDFSNAVSGQKITIALNFSGALRTIAWTPTIKWAGGTAPTGPDASGKVLLLTIAYLGTTYYGSFEIFS